MASANAATGGFEVPGDERGEPRFPMMHYLSAFDGFLHSKRFAAMPRNGDQLTVFDTWNKKECHTAVGAWTRR